MAVSVLIVEDDENVCELLVLSLGQGYKTEVAHSIAQAQTCLSKLHFDVVLLDYHLPDGAGVIISEQLKELSERPIVIFLSASKELDKKMAAFNSGAIDWIDKSQCAPTMLNLKLEQALKFRAKYRQIAQAEQASTEAVYVAMSDSFVWGHTARAIRSCLTTHSISGFLNAIFHYLSELNLLAAIAINENKGLTIWDSPEDAATGLEQEVMCLAMQKGDRILKIGRRYFFQTENISMLIKNIPDDEIKQGQLIDVLTAYVECAEHHLVSINKDMIKQLYFSKVSEALDLVKFRMHEFNKETNDIQNQQSMLFFEVFNKLQLTDDEEKSLTEVTDSTLMKFEEMALEHFKIVNDLEEVMAQFKKHVG